jgi:hypothetical protein
MRSGRENETKALYRPGAQKVAYLNCINSLLGPFLLVLAA